MNIILCGFKNCGKSTIGAALAKKLDYQFDDTDRLIEEYYRKDNNEVLGAAEIYTRHGQEIFRELEKDVILALEHQDNRVVALGGGVILNPDSTAHLHKLGKIIYLRASKELLRHRMLASRIPAFIDEADFDASFDKMYLARYALYEKIADFIVDVDKKPIKDLVDEIRAVAGNL